MSQLLQVVLLLNLVGLLKQVAGLTIHEDLCTADNKGRLDNEYLIGEWYQLYKFVLLLKRPTSMSCPQYNITWPNISDLERYKTAYGEAEPFHFDETAVLFQTGFMTGMITGGENLKYFAWDPLTPTSGKSNNEAQVFKKINDDYMLHYKCTTKFSRWLLSRKKHPPEDELEEIVSDIDELKGMHRQRFCVKWK